MLCITNLQKMSCVGYFIPEIFKTPCMLKNTSYLNIQLVKDGSFNRFTLIFLLLSYGLINVCVTQLLSIKLLLLSCL